MHCLRCNTDNPPAEIYCTRCGAVLAPETGELRSVTVLFADIRGFTALSERRTAEEIATRVINECFTLLAEQIEAYGGVVDKFIGDAVMALFGAPRAHENDPERAIMAALGMQAVLARFSARVEKLLGTQLEMRIGINTGEAVAAWFGSARNRAYTVIGDTVNLASRIEHAARPGKIWVHETTYRQTMHAFDFEAIGPLTLKGKSKPVTVYQVRRPRAVRERQRGMPGLRAPMVDRREGLAALRHAFAQAVQGHGIIVSLVGEAGIGKSRLLAEFEEQAHREGQLAETLALKGRSLPYGQLNTYGTVREILNGYLGNGHGEATPDTLRARADARDAPLLGQLLGLGIPLDRYESLPPEELQREIHQAVIRLFHHAARARPLLIVFEDVHWIDPSSLALLGELLPSLSEKPALACCLYRPDFSGLADVLGHHVRIAIPPLSESESRELVQDLLAVEDLPESLKQTIIQKATGNPFYVEEMLKSLIEAGAITQRDGRWAVTGDLADVSVPDTVQGVIMTRIDGLPDATKHTLQQAAVIGPTFRASLLAEIADSPQVTEQLAHLVELDFIVAGSGDEYRFKNLLTQEVAYNSLLLTQRQTLHQRIAATLERNYADRLESQYATLADHYERGGLWPKALEYRKKAGARAQRLYDNSVAIAHLTRALDIISRWEQGPQSLLDAERAEAYPGAPPGFFDAQRAEMWASRGDVLALTGQYDLALADFQSALERAGDEEVRAELNWRIGSVHEKLGQYDAALTALQAGIALVESRPRSSALLKLLSTLGWVFIRQGQSEQARKVSMRSLALCKAHNPREAALALKSLGYAAFIQGDLNEAATHWQRSLSLVEQVGDQRELARVNNNLGMVAARRGLFDDAISHFQRALKVLERIGDAEGIPTIYANLGGAYSEEGHFDEARRCYLHALQTHETLGHALEAAACQLNLGELARKTSDLPAAIDYLTRSRDAMEKLGAVEDLPEVYRQLAETYLAANDLPAAYQHGAHALDYARKTGNRLEEGIVHRVLGQIAEEQSQPDRALGHLTQSRIILEELGSEHELALTLIEEAALLESEAQCETLKRAREILRRLGASEAEGVKRLMAAFGCR
jgi:class 3 adenylate cyclase/tetratricopeptide (TPR) repeat protein